MSPGVRWWLMSPEQIGGLVIRPGDSLVLTYDRFIDAQTADEVKQRITTLLPDLDKVVIISGASAIAAYRPGRDVPDA